MIFPHCFSFPLVIKKMAYSGWAPLWFLHELFLWRGELFSKIIIQPFQNNYTAPNWLLSINESNDGHMFSMSLVPDKTESMLHLIPFPNTSLCSLKALSLLLSISASVAYIPVASKVVVGVLVFTGRKAENMAVIHFQGTHPRSGKPCERNSMGF